MFEQYMKYAPRGSHAPIKSFWSSRSTFDLPFDLIKTTSNLCSSLVAFVKSNIILDEFVKFNDCDFCCTFACKKFRSVVNTNLPGNSSQEIAPYFPRWCAIPPKKALSFSFQN